MKLSFYLLCCTYHPFFNQMKIKVCIDWLVPLSSSPLKKVLCTLTNSLVIGSKLFKAGVKRKKEDKQKGLYIKEKLQWSQ